MIRYEDIATAIQVRHLEVDIDEALTFGIGDPAAAAAAAMAERGFDQAPVVAGGSVIGLVRRASLSGVALVGDRFDPIHTEHLVSADAPVSQALVWLRDTPCLFVLDGRRITGFFVEADLNKQPARTYFYLMVASLEAGLAQLLREWAGGVEARLEGAMSERMWKRVAAAREEAQVDDVDADLVTYLLFSDVLRMVGAIPEIRGKLGARGPRHWNKLTGSLVGLRNAVMHPARDLVGRGRSLDQLNALDGVLRVLLLRLEEPPGAVVPNASSGT